MQVEPLECRAQQPGLRESRELDTMRAAKTRQPAKQQRGLYACGNGNSEEVRCKDSAGLGGVPGGSDAAVMPAVNIPQVLVSDTADSRWGQRCLLRLETGGSLCQWQWRVSLQQQPAAWPSEGNARFTTASHRWTSLAQPHSPHP